MTEAKRHATCLFAKGDVTFMDIEDSLGNVWTRQIVEAEHSVRVESFVTPAPPARFHAAIGAAVSLDELFAIAKTVQDIEEETGAHHDGLFGNWRKWPKFGGDALKNTYWSWSETHAMTFENACFTLVKRTDLPPDAVA